MNAVQPILRRHVIRLRAGRLLACASIALLGLGGAARGQSFKVVGAGGNTFGHPPASCQFNVTEAQPLTETRECSDSKATWSGTAAADRGVLHEFAYAEYHLPGTFTLGAEYHVTSEFSAADLVVSGPAAASIPVTLRLDVVYSGLEQPGGGLAWADGTLRVDPPFTLNTTFLGTVSDRVEIAASIAPNSPLHFEVTTTANASAAGPGSSSASSTLTLRFPIGEPVFVLPAGYTADSPTLGIAANSWVGPDQSTCPPMAYGSAKINSQGCLPAIGSQGSASASSAAPFLVTASNVLNNKSGLLFYGYAPASQPFQGGTKLVANPVKRTPVQDSAGNPPPDDCSGTFSYDMNARIHSGTDPNLVAGADVYCQYWSRDPADPDTTNLTDGLFFLISP
jgi:hypothetical protein